MSDETYKDIKEENSIYGINNGLSARITDKVVGAIQNGTPLPKGHGRLIDLDALCDEHLSGCYIELEEHEISEIPVIIEGTEGKE